jgi:hypothetical protein
MMANYVPIWRSNYFHIKDRATFRNFVNSFDHHVDLAMENADDPTSAIALFQSDSSETGIPTERIHPTTGDPEDCDFVQELAAHLCDSEVAILQEVGYESRRYLVGDAIAVRSDGQILAVSLNDIYDRVQSRWNLAPTRAEY